jgi:hypothetical protein
MWKPPQQQSVEGINVATTRERGSVNDLLATIIWRCAQHPLANSPNHGCEKWRGLSSANRLNTITAELSTSPFQDGSLPIGFQSSSLMNHVIFRHVDRKSMRTLCIVRAGDLASQWSLIQSSITGGQMDYHRSAGEREAPCRTTKDLRTDLGCSPPRF